MDSRGKFLVSQMGKAKSKMVGDVMHHAVDGAHDGGELNKVRRHAIKKALHKKRLRASGMSDELFGSKEVGGINENEYEERA
jgi:hypothetical protein